MDTLTISKLKIATRIGIHRWEQQIEQPLLIDIQIPLDASQCHDLLENTIDYAKLCDIVTDYVGTNTFKLIETVGENVATLIKTAFNIKEVTVAISKPNAIRNAENICMTIRR